MKYPKKLVQDYLSGVEINDYDIDELEDNHEFMEQAIIMPTMPNLLRKWLLII